MSRNVERVVLKPEPPLFHVTDLENSASTGARERAAAQTSGIDGAAFPSRRSLRASAGSAPAAHPDTHRTASTRPPAPGSRRAAREAEERASEARDSAREATASVPPVPPAPTPAAASPIPVTIPTARRAEHPVRKRLSVAGTMLFVSGLFASLTLPAYASGDFSGQPASASASLGSQELALDDVDADEVVGAVEARDSYDATSAADLQRLYRDAVRQQNLQDYLASGAMAMGDDYPWPAELTRGQGGGLSPLNYFYRECVDFVAWRLNRDAGSTSAPFKYTWSYLTPGGGSAVSWKRQWENHGWAISTTPQPGWVAWFPNANHVAYVSGVLSDGSVAIEEYNWGPNIYNQRVIAAGDAIYLSPPPR